MRVPRIIFGELPQLWASPLISPRRCYAMAQWVSSLVVATAATRAIGPNASLRWSLRWPNEIRLAVEKLRLNTALRQSEAQLAPLGSDSGTNHRFCRHSRYPLSRTTYLNRAGRKIMGSA